MEKGYYSEFSDYPRISYDEYYCCKRKTPHGYGPPDFPGNIQLVKDDIAWDDIEEWTTKYDRRRCECLLPKKTERAENCSIPPKHSDKLPWDEIMSDRRHLNVTFFPIHGAPLIRVRRGTGSVLPPSERPPTFKRQEDVLEQMVYFNERLQVWEDPNEEEPMVSGCTMCKPVKKPHDWNKPFYLKPKLIRRPHTSCGGILTDSSLRARGGFVYWKEEFQPILGGIPAVQRKMDMLSKGSHKCKDV